MSSFFNRFDEWMDGLKSGIASGIKPLSALLDIFTNPIYGAAVITCVFVIVLLINILRYKSDSIKKLKEPYTLTVCAMMIALNIALGYFTLDMSSYLRIGFGFVTQPIIGLMFGPTVCCITGVLQDIVSLALRPTGAWLPMYTISVGIAGMVYGMMLYNKRISIWRIFLTKAVVILFVNIVLNSIALAPTVGSGLIGILPSRIIKNIMLLPVQTVIVYALLKAVEGLNLRRTAKARR